MSKREVAPGVYIDTPDIIVPPSNNPLGGLTQVAQSGLSIDHLIDSIVQYQTRGALGFSTGRGRMTAGFTQGVTTTGSLRAINEGVGEISGRNLMRDELAKNQARLEAAQAEAVVERQQQQERSHQMALQASYSRPGTRTGAITKLGSQEQDFLGL